MKRFSCSHVSPLNSLSHKQGHSPFLSLSVCVPLTLGIRKNTPECTPPHMPSVNKLFPTTILIIIVFLFLCSAFSLLFPIQWMVVLYVPTHHHYSHNPFFFLFPPPPSSISRCCLGQTSSGKCKWTNCAIVST